MTDYFHIEMTKDELGTISVLGLAHIGDAVYELLTRAKLCAHGKRTSRSLHRDTVARVCACAQAAAAEKLEPQLNEEERNVYRRGRNAKVNS
ncbi:MAG: ribonuclease III, partial [Clostridia bacterium]|nr:ribonuclease III [Clostridia bacterium]